MFNFIWLCVYLDGWAQKTDNSFLHYYYGYKCRLFKLIGPALLEKGKIYAENLWGYSEYLFLWKWTKFDIFLRQKISEEFLLKNNKVI